MRTVGRVLELWRYPVSSLQGETLDELRFENGGVAGDRAYGLFDAATQTIANPDTEKRWRVAPLLAARTRESTVEIRAGDAWHDIDGAAAAVSASGTIGFPVSFVRFGSSLRSGATAGRRYQLAGVHMVTTASLSALEALAPAGSQVDRRRFRPNIVVETQSGLEGFVEKEWVGSVVSIGQARIAVIEPCERCSFVSLAQGDLAFAPPVLHAVARHGGGFGVLAENRAADAAIRVGDAVMVD